MRRVSVYVLLASLVFSPFSTQTWAQQIPREFGAQGGPIADAVNCDGAAERVNRMARGLPKQEEMIRNIEAQRDAARRASDAADARATDRVQGALLDQIKGKITDAAQDFVKSTQQFKKAAEFVDDKAAELGISEANKERVSKAYEIAEERAEVWKAYDAGRQGGRELMQANRNLLDDAASLNKVFVDSGIADKTFDALTDHAMKNPVTAPYAVGGKVARVLIDVGVATGESWVEGDVAMKLENTLIDLRATRDRMQARVLELKTSCLNPRQQQRAEQERQEGEREAQREVEQEARTTQAARSSSGGGAGKAIVGAAAAGGGAVATLYAWNEYKKAQEEADELLNSLPGGGGSTGGGSTGGGSTGGGANQFDGTYTATASRSCTPGSGAAEPCNQAFASGSCSPTSFTFTVSGGVVRDTCGWLSAASISSSGLYSGRYTGTASTNLLVTGSFSTTSSFPLTGSETYRGNAYSATITITKR